jgi:predicted Rossmann-fold nucleotide-binding protein
MRQLGFHNKPLAFISTDGYWDTFLEFIRQLTAGKFLLPEHESLIHVVSTPEEALQYVDTFVPAPLPDKWGRSKESSRP